MCPFADVIHGPTFLRPKSFVNDADSVWILGIYCHHEPATSLAFDFAFSTESHIPHGDTWPHFPSVCIMGRDAKKK